MGATEEAHSHAFWVLTVIGGLSAARALEDAFPAISLSHWTPQNGVIILRLFIFVLTAVRMFIGASVFFQEVHFQPCHDTNFQRRNYVFDYGSVLIHFGLLYWMAASITLAPDSIPSLESEQFFVSLCAVLVYDWIWYLASVAYSTKPIIFKWAIWNSVTLVPCLLIFWAFMYFKIDRMAFEISLAFIIMLFAIQDLVRLSRGILPTKDIG